MVGWGVTTPDSNFPMLTNARHSTVYTELRPASLKHRRLDGQLQCDARERERAHQRHL